MNEMTTPPTTKRKTTVAHCSRPQVALELYQVIVHCRTEAEQRRLFNRLRREGFRCRLTVL